MTYVKLFIDRYLPSNCDIFWSFDHVHSSFHCLGQSQMGNIQEVGMTRSADGCHFSGSDSETKCSHVYNLYTKSCVASENGKLTSPPIVQTLGNAGNEYI